MTLNCFKCHAEVIFDSDHIGKNGKKIPLDPATKQPHDCPMREKRWNAGVTDDDVSKAMGLDEEKDDHGKEEEWGNPIPIPNAVKPNKTDYVDHTLKGQQRFQAFQSDSAAGLTKIADKWIDETEEFIQVKLIGQLQLSADGKTFAIALYYEEVAA